MRLLIHIMSIFLLAIRTLRTKVYIYIICAYVVLKNRQIYIFLGNFFLQSEILLFIFITIRNFTLSHT